VSSPTRRSLEHLRKAGAELVAVVERWNPHAKIRQDLFGVVDVLAIHGGDTIAVQATSDSNVVPLDRRRSRGPLWGVAAVAAAAGAIVGGAVVWSAVDRGTGSTGVNEQFVAQAVLAPLTDTVSAPGQATVLDSTDGKVVRVDARSLPANDGFYEVWLLDADATKLVALGALPAGSIGTFTIPPGLSIADFPLIDISLESYDGDPSHSKNSLMRGELQA